MTALPDFTPCGYQVTEQLNRNLQAGRNTYKALEITTQNPVVIKQFRFATTGDWASYKEIEREIEVLKGLNHPGIPQYLEKFDPGDGLCLVQEYKAAQPLSQPRSFSPDDIKTIAIQLLEILVYLQARIPPVFHRDIKPENVLVDQSLQVYLIDFGLARIGNSTMAVSSIMGGTLGFMPPEQVHNQKLTEASDLYGLGATLICLITQTKSSDLGSLVNFATNKIVFKDKVAKFSFKFIEWLEKMVEPEPANRYENANLALEALKPLYLNRIPEVKLDLDKLELDFVANSLGEKLSKTIRVSNPIPDTILEGKWSVSPHPSDPPHTPERHSWISFFPREFKGNGVDCVVKVDTSKLRANKHYERNMVLTSNGKQENYELKIKVKTALIPKLDIPLPHSLFVTELLVLIFYLVLYILSEVLVPIEVHLLAIILVILVGVILIYKLCRGFYNYKRGTIKLYKSPMTWCLYNLLRVATVILMIVSIGIGFDPYLLTALTASTLFLTVMLIYPSWKRQRLKAQYRRQESQNLIEP